MSSKIKTKQDLHPHSEKNRICSRCKSIKEEEERKEVTFLQHISIIAKRKNLRGSFELLELHELLEEFTNHDVEVFCNDCKGFARYNTCDCGKFRYTKQIQTLDNKENIIYFTLCAECANDLFNINYDEYGYRQDSIKLRRKNYD